MPVIRNPFRKTAPPAQPVAEPLSGDRSETDVYASKSSSAVDIAKTDEERNTYKLSGMWNPRRAEPCRIVLPILLLPPI